MENLQDKVNYLARLLRVQTIEHLVKEDRLKYGAAQPGDEELEYFKYAVNKMPCCTRMLRRLFQDAHDMHEDKGMFPHAACVADLEWCMRYRSIGYSCSQQIRHNWLPFKEDEDLRRLPAMRELSKIYAPMLAAGKRIIPPVDTRAIEREANAIVNMLSTELTTKGT